MEQQRKRSESESFSLAHAQAQTTERAKLNEERATLVAEHKNALQQLEEQHRVALAHQRSEIEARSRKEIERAERAAKDAVATTLASHAKLTVAYDKSRD